MIAPLPRVLVVGSINRDVYLDSDRLPQPGETIEITRTSLGTGGKGANQASAAAHAGARVTLVGAVGMDEGGQRALDDLRSVGVDVGAVDIRQDDVTGTAWVFRDCSGRNLIGIHAGANHAIRQPRDELFTQNDIAVCQGEVRPSLLADVAAAAVRQNCRFVLNLAPVIPVHHTVISAADPLVVNEHEADELVTTLGHKDVSDLQSTVELLSSVARSVVVTLGARGALSAVAGKRQIEHPAARVERVVDTTGAGDALIGALATALARGADLAQAVREGCVEAGRKVGLPGAFVKGL